MAVCVVAVLAVCYVRAGLVVAGILCGTQRWRAQACGRMLRPHQGDGPGDGDDLCRLDIVLEAAHGALKLSGVRVDCHAGSVRNPGAVRHHALAGGSSASTEGSFQSPTARCRTAWSLTSVAGSQVSVVPGTGKFQVPQVVST